VFSERESLWKSFKEDVVTPQKQERENMKLVKIVKKFRFAGEDITYTSILSLSDIHKLT
jgi:hypothetical protein